MSAGLQLLDAESGEVVVDQLWVADRFVSRLIGLQFRKPLRAGTALLLVPCTSIHTCFMRFTIDVAWLDRDGRVLAVTQGLRPWRVAVAPRGTYAVAEATAGGIFVLPGQILRIGASDTCPLQRSLAFLSDDDA